ncbi:MAG: filamentous hemagglutinin N-terminal domain-containing protein [Sphingomonas sp.]|uniref:beta strand repeat-containing protein n=1 Tax=Sphingomonas sp. TaxID=28214 RepID=UPI0025F179F7|nr:YDG domain-containing protein [Sphingomonas sp.]MBX9883255.1 filamentous hemagglutinin N-terminal domain-containing protein [Sphingomonas sp.]
MTTRSLLRLALIASTATAALAAMPAAAQNLPDTGNVTVVTRGLGGTPGPTTPTFNTVTLPAAAQPTLQIGLRDNRTILTWRGTGFDIGPLFGVSFTDARATTGVTNRTANIAVLNRDLSGSASNIRGFLNASSNIAVFVINPSGINFGGPADANISVGSLIASTSDLSDDNDFLNALSALRFSRSGTGGIDSAGLGITANGTNATGDGGRVGDVVLIGQQIRNQQSFTGVNVNAPNGDVAMLAASDVTVQFAPGSPLAFTITRGTSSTTANPLSLGQAINARNVTLGLFSSGGGPGFPLSMLVTGTITATGASITDRGVVLVADAAAPGVTLASTPNNLTGQIGNRSSINIQNAVNSAADLYFATGSGAFGVNGLSRFTPQFGGATTDGSFTAARLLRIDGGAFVGANNQNVIRGGSLQFNTGVNTSALVQATNGDVVFGAPTAAFAFGNSLTATGNITGSFSTLNVTGTGNANVFAGGLVNLTGFVTISGPNISGLVANGSVTINGPVSGSRIESTGGGVTLRGNSVFLNSLQARGAIDVTSTLGNIRIGQIIGSSSVALAAPTASSDGLIQFDSLTGGDVTIAGFGVSGTNGNFANAGRISAGSLAMNLNTTIGTAQLGDVVAARGVQLTAASINAVTLQALGGDVSLTASRSVAVSSSVNASGGITVAGGAINPSTITLNNVTSGTGNVSISSIGTNAATILLNNVQSGRDLLVQTSAPFGRVTLQNGFNVAGAATLSAIGGTIEFGNSTNNVFSYRANGQLSITAGSINTLNTATPITLMANAAGSTVNPATLDLYVGAGGPGFLSLATNTVLMGGPARQSDVRVRVDNGSIPLTFGALSARALLGAVGANAAFAPGLITTGPITTGGAWTLTNGLVLGGQSLSLNNITVTNGNINLRAAGTGFNPGLTLNSTLNASGDLIARTDAGPLILGANARLTGTTVSLATPANFINQTTIGTSPITGRWAIYAAAPTGNNFGNGNLFSNNTAIWNGTIDTRPIAGLTGNRYVFAFRPTLTVAPSNFSKVYGTDLTGAGAAIPFTVTGLMPGLPTAFLADTQATALSGAPAFTSAGFATRASVAGGPYAVTTALGTLNSPSGYAIALGAPAQLTVTPRALTGTAIADSKTYDGTTAGTGRVTLNGVVAGDTVGTAGTTFTFADKNAGLGKTVTVAGTTLTGADAGNYTLTVPASVLADILPRLITAGVVVRPKVYDGNTTANTVTTLEGVIAGDDVGTTGTVGVYDNKNAGTDKLVTISGITLTGADAGNYTLQFAGSVFGDILRAALTANVVVNNKTYDGNRNATGTVTLNGVVAGDQVGTSGAIFTFSDKNAGTGKTVTISGTTLTGADAGNYTLAVPATAFADILRAALTASVRVNNKTYDGNRNATGTVTLNGVVAGDQVATTGTSFTFSDKNAGTGKTVSVTGTALTGADAGNYTLTVPATALADILRAALTASVSVNNKTYDGNRNATGTVTLNGVVAGDQVATTGTSFTFSDKNAGTGKTVSVTGTALTGADAGNYTLTVPATALADILRAALTANVTVNAKTYDGTRTGSGTVTLNGVVAGDQVGTAGTGFTFASANAGAGISVAVNGTTLTGADAGNYTLNIPATVLGTINRRAITITADSLSKPQGSADPVLSYRLTSGSLVAGDVLTGALTRSTGEIPGNYSILLGSLAASTNYTLSFVPGTFTITRVGNTPQQQFQSLQGITLPNVINVPAVDAPPVLNLPTLDLCAGTANCQPAQ